MSSVFPDISVNRVDVKNETIKIFASIDTINSTVRPFWLEEEDFAPFINCEFAIAMEVRRDSNPNLNIIETVFDQSIRLPSLRLSAIEELQLPRAIITLEEIKQSPYGISVDNPITVDYVTNKIHFELDFALRELGLSEEGLVNMMDILQAASDVGSDFAINMIYYTHVNVAAIEENFGIRNGQGEIRRLGGIGKFQPLVFGDSARKKLVSQDLNLVSVQLGQDGGTTFEGYFGLPQVLESQDDTVSNLPGPGLPDPDAWRSRINYDSIYGSGFRVEDYLSEDEIVRKIKEQLAIKSAKDHSYGLMHYFSWNSRQTTIDQQDLDANIGDIIPNRLPRENPPLDDVNAYSSLFVFDILEVIKNMSPLGFLLEKDYSKLPDADYFSMIEQVMTNTRIEKLKITRKRMSNSPIVCNKTGTPEYKVLHEANDAMILADMGDTERIINTIDEEFHLLVANLAPRSTENLNFFFSEAVVLHDLDLYEKGKEGQKYKYYIEMSLFDGIPEYVSEKLKSIKEGEKFIKRVLASAEGLKSELDQTSRNIFGDIQDTIVTQNYDFATEQWSQDFVQADYTELESAIDLYFTVLSLLGIPTTQQTSDDLKSSVLPSRNGSLDSLQLFYKSFKQLEKTLILMYDRVTNFEEGLDSELYGVKRMVPSNDRTNILDLCFYTPDTLHIEPREGLIADFRNLRRLDQGIIMPEELCLEVLDDQRKVSSPIIYQNPQNQMTVFPAVADEIERYDYLLDYISRGKRKGLIYAIDDRLISNFFSPETGPTPLNLEAFKRRTANITDYLPSTTFEMPSIKRSFRAEREGIAQNNSGLESESFAILEATIIDALSHGDDLTLYLEQLLSELTNENLASYLSSDDFGESNLQEIVRIVKTIESFQEEYSRTSVSPSNPSTSGEFTTKFTPKVATVTILTQSGEVIERDPGTLNEVTVTFAYVDKNHQGYKRNMTTIVNSALL